MFHTWLKKCKTLQTVCFPIENVVPEVSNGTKSNPKCMPKEEAEKKDAGIVKMDPKAA